MERFYILTMFVSLYETAPRLPSHNSIKRLRNQHKNNEYRVNLGARSRDGCGEGRGVCVFTQQVSEQRYSHSVAVYLITGPQVHITSSSNNIFGKGSIK